MGCTFSMTSDSHLEKGASLQILSFLSFDLQPLLDCLDERSQVCPKLQNLDSKCEIREYNQLIKRKTSREQWFGIWVKFFFFWCGVSINLLSYHCFKCNNSLYWNTAVQSAMYFLSLYWTQTDRLLSLLLLVIPYSLFTTQQPQGFF